MEWRQNFLAFLAVVVEFILGAAVFYLIILVAYALQYAIAFLHEPEDSFLYIVARGGKIVLLITDCLIGTLFVTSGIRNAWRATWG